MEVSNVSGHTLAPTPATTALEETNALGKGAFLQLLIAQLEHQDPLSPMANDEFVAQLAQFNTLEQMQAMNGNLSSMFAAQEQATRIQAAELVGKDVTVHSDTTLVRQGEPAVLHYTLDENPAEVVIRILDDTGQTVRTLAVSDQQAGKQIVEWDGRDDQGASLPEGHYRFAVAATDIAGNAIAVDTFVQGMVEGVEYTETQPVLVVGGKRVEFSALMSVDQGR